MDGTIRVRTAVWFATAVVLSVFATLLVSQEWRADAAPGDSDSTFAPVTPCRLFDYRPGESPAGGMKTPLVAGSPATQQVTGTVGNCVIPDTGVVAVAMNVTAVDGTAQSNLRLYPADATEPLVSNMNWKAGDSATANKVDVKLSSAGAIKVANFNGTVNVIGDIVGYYTDSSLKELAATAGTQGPAGPAGPAGADGLQGPAGSNGASQSFTRYNEIIGEISLSNNATMPTNVISRTVTAPVDGTFSVHVSAYAGQGDADADHVNCEIDTGGTVLGPIIAGSPMPTGAWPGMAGSRSFDVLASSTKIYKLLCYELGNGTQLKMYDRTMTVIFTPAP
jgi:hypothetical protein